MSETLEAMAAPLHERGLAVSSIITTGDPKHVLLDEAKHWGADSLFVGARGLSRIERFLLGSVSSALAARAHCSVEVVRPASPGAALEPAILVEHAMLPEELRNAP